MANAQPHLQLLQEGAKQLGVALSPETLVQFSIYLEELILWSAKIALVSQTDRLTIIRKHFLDSLAVIPHILEAKTILDLGSGAGFPGVPVAIFLPQASVTLLETRRKRVNFLKEVARKIESRNLTVHEGRAEILAEKKPLQRAFDVVMTRATWDIETFLCYTLPFLAERGRGITMRGPHIDARELKTARQTPSFSLENHYMYTLPFGTEQRQLLIFHQRKVSRAT